MKRVCTCLARSIANPDPAGSEYEPTRPLVRCRVLAAISRRVASTSPDSFLSTAMPIRYKPLADPAPIRRRDVPTGGEHMQKWEYATVPLISHAPQEILNQWGEEGWELVQVLESPTTGTTAYLKRQKSQ